MLFASGIMFAWVGDKIVKILKITPCATCLEGHCEQCLSETEGPEKVLFYSLPSSQRQRIRKNISAFFAVR
jgi:hypothetical protein